MSGEAQAGRYLLRALGPVQVKFTTHTMFGTDLACQYLRGKAACELGWLAADLASRRCRGRLRDGWALIVKELGREGVEPLAQKALTVALEVAHPGQSLFDQASRASSAQSETRMYLCAAFEWSEVLLAMCAGNDENEPAIWHRLSDFFNRKNTPETLAEMQSALAVRLDWTGPGRPFDNLARLHREVEYGLQCMVYDFSAYARCWENWIKWQRDQLR